MFTPEPVQVDFPYNPDMDLISYANERVSFNIIKYRWKAKMCRNIYLYTNLLGILFSSAVPILINLKINQLVPTVISFLVVVVVSLEKVFHFRDRWKNYQTTEESLRKELYLVETKSGKYKGKNYEEQFDLLVSSVELIIEQERKDTIVVRSAEIKTESKV